MHIWGCKYSRIVWLLTAFNVYHIILSSYKQLDNLGFLDFLETDLMGRCVVNIDIALCIQIMPNLLLSTLIARKFSCYPNQDELGRIFQSPNFKGLHHNTQLCKYVLLNVAIQP